MADSNNNKPSTKRVLWRAAAGDVCDTYRQALARGVTVSVEGLLSRVPEAEQTAVLWAMLRSEVLHLRSVGTQPDREDFLRRFPNHGALIDAVLPNHDDRQRIESAMEGDELVRTVGVAPLGSVYQVRRIPGGELCAIRDLPCLLIDASRRDDCQISDPSFMFHKNLARPFELLEVDDHVLLVTEYVEGESLARLIGRTGPASIGAACEILKQAADGLAQVHEHWRCHGDVRPQNLVIDTTHLAIKVVGVGLTELIDPLFLRYAETAPGEIDARPFRAPELQDSPPRLDLLSDVYGLGAVLYFALTGRCPEPLRAGDLAIQLHQHRPDCPAALEALVGQMTTQTSEERPATAAQVRDALAPFADRADFARWADGAGQSTSRPPQTVVTAAPAKPATPKPPFARPVEAARAIKPSRRRLSWGAAALAAAVLLAAAVGYTLWSQPGAPQAADAPVWASALVEQPSVHGDWWFDEAPWNTPVVRVAILERARRNESLSARIDLQSTSRSLAIAPDRQAADDARQVIKELSTKAKGPEWEAVRTFLLTDPDRQTATDRESQYRLLLDALPEADDSPASLLHTRGLLRHSLGEHDAALEAYDQACAAYAAAGMPQVEAVCHADAARLHRDRRDYVRAIERLNRSNELAISSARLVSNDCQLAYCNRKRGYIEEAKKCLNEAETVAGDPARMPLGPRHPLHSALLAEHGWLDLDDWSLERADRWFEKADQLIEDGVNPDDITEFYKQLWVRQNRAMVRHYRGEAEAAREIYAKILSDIRAQLARNLKPRQAARIASRQPNLYERLGDSYLCGSPADYAKAAATYNQAYRAAIATGSGFDMASGWPYVVNFRCKQAVALSLGQQVENAAQVLAEIDELLAEHDEITAGQRACYRGAKLLATTIQAFNEPSAEKVFDKHHDALADYCVSRVRAFSEKGHVSRSEIDLLLLSVELLLQPSNAKASTVDDLIDNLQYLTDKVYRDGGVTDAYLRRYAQVAIACGDSYLGDGEQSLDRLRQIASRGAKLVGPPASGRVTLNTEGLPSNCRLFALNIGVSNYREPALKLRHGHDDARFLSECFTSLCEGENALYEKGFVKTLCDSDATRRGIFSWIDAFQQGRDSEGLPAVRPTDLVFVTFSGHGVRAHRDRSYLLLPHDYETGEDATAIHNVMLADKLAALGATVVLVLDSCFSGHAFDTEMLAARGEPGDELRRLAAEQVRKFNEGNRAGVVVLASSVSEQESFEDHRLGHGFLTAALGEALLGKYLAAEDRAPPIPTGVGSGMVTLKDVEYYLGQRVLHLSNRRQRLPDARGVSGAASLAELPIRVAIAH